MLLQYKYVDLEFPACLEAKNPASPALFTQTRLGMYELMDNRHASLLIVSINYLWAGKGCKKMEGASNRKPKMEYGDLHFFIAARLSNNTNKFPSD